MNDLLRSQIKESCTSALPEGLKELMCDISREVLRTQPRDLYKFIAEYLLALLVTRENLSIASRICGNTCSCSCHPELDDELRYIGLDDEDAAKTRTVIMEHFEDSKINEGNIMLKIIKNTTISEDLLPSIQEAIRKAFLRHQINHTIIYETSSDSDKDEVARAARHTLELYRKTQPNDKEYNKMVEKVQASYRAYGVTREKNSTSGAVDNVTKIQDYAPVEAKVDEEETSPSYLRTSLKTISSTCLAGSYLHLPKYIPYSVHDIENLTDLEEAPEKEHAYIDYTEEHSHVVIATNEGQDYEEFTENIENNEVVNSHDIIAIDDDQDGEEFVEKIESKEVVNPHEIEDCAIDAGNESECSIEEVVNEVKEGDGHSDGDQIIFTTMIM